MVLFFVLFSFFSNFSVLSFDEIKMNINIMQENVICEDGANL